MSRTPRLLYTLPLAALLAGCPPKEKPPEAAPDTGVTKTPTTAMDAADIPAPADVAAPPADAEKTPSGLASKVLQAGTGTVTPQIQDMVSVHYTGWTTDGKMFDSSVKRGQPATFPLKNVIPGWSEGVQLMKKGEKRRLWIPDTLAYKGRPGPQGMLVFDIELLEIKPGPKPIPAPADAAEPPKDAKKTKSGLVYKIIEKGKGKKKPGPTDIVKVHYTGWSQRGEMVDSSVQRGIPAEFPLDRVQIAGWQEGVQLMNVGDKARFWIPEDLAYKGRPGAPSGTLVFDIELIEMKEGPKPIPAPKDVKTPPKDAKKTESGLFYKVLKKGTGTDHPTRESRVEVHYTGWTTDGKMFDSSVVRGQPAVFGLGQVIPGWTEGLQLMVKGEKARLWIPENLAYQGVPGAPQGMLVFDVELIDIK